MNGTSYHKRYNVSDIYFNIRDDKQIILEISNYIKTINKDRYIVHCFKNTQSFSRESHNNIEFYSSLVIFDNYGDFCIIDIKSLEKYNKTSGEQKTIVKILKDPNFKINLCFTSKYKLPNILIDFIKNEFVETFIFKDYEQISRHHYNPICVPASYFCTNNQYITGGTYKCYSGIEKQMRPLNILSEEYYKRFTKDKKIEELFESNQKYLKEIEQLKEDIFVKNLLISSLQNDKPNKETNYDPLAFCDILLQQYKIKELQDQIEIFQEQIEEYKKQIHQFEKEKDENLMKYNAMQDKIKKLLDIQ
jgi:hypothetical protein